MSHIYQPLMIRTLLTHGGRASIRQIASMFLSKDASQLEYYEEITKNIPGKVLARHGIVSHQFCNVMLLRQRVMEIIKLHERMVRNLFLNVELMLNDNVRELSEYDLQGLMFLFFRAALANTKGRADREKNGKVDCVLYENNAPTALYELKTYFKNHERLTKKHFDKDLKKLADRLQANNGARGFFVIAGAKQKFTDKALQKFQFVKDRLDPKYRKWAVWKWSDTKEKKRIRIRPSQKQHRGRSVVISWEVVIQR